MSLLRKKKDATADTRASAGRRVRQQASQAVPLAKSAGAAARQGADEVVARARPHVRKARRWAAPRVERTGRVVQEKVAPQVAEKLAKAARRLDPAPEPRRRPGLARVLTVATAAASIFAAVAVLRRRISPPGTGAADTTAAEAEPGAGEQAMAPPADAAAKVDVNGQVRTG
jgi:hypothetical protein